MQRNETKNLTRSLIIKKRENQKKFLFFSKIIEHSVLAEKSDGKTNKKAPPERG